MGKIGDELRKTRIRVAEEKLANLRGESGVFSPAGSKTAVERQVKKGFNIIVGLLAIGVLLTLFYGIIGPVQVFSGTFEGILFLAATFVIFIVGGLAFFVLTPIMAAVGFLAGGLALSISMVKLGIVGGIVILIVKFVLFKKKVKSGGV